MDSVNRTYPDAALVIVGKLTDPNGRPIGDSLKNLLGAIGTAKPSLRASPIYKRLQLLV